MIEMLKPNYIYIGKANENVWVVRDKKTWFISYDLGMRSFVMSISTKSFVMIIGSRSLEITLDSRNFVIKKFWFSDIIRCYPTSNEFKYVVSNIW